MTEEERNKEIKARIEESRKNMSQCLKDFGMGDQKKYPPDEHNLWKIKKTEKMLQGLLIVVKKFSSWMFE